MQRCIKRHKKIERLLDKSLLISIHTSAYMIMKVYFTGPEILPLILPYIIIPLITIWRKGELRTYLNMETLTIIFYLSQFVLFFWAVIEYRIYGLGILYGTWAAHGMYTGFREGLD